MPVQVSYPGVYIEEISSGVHTIIGVATSITAFIGRAPIGPVNEPSVINGLGDFTRQFGGLDKDYPMSYAVQDFFLNGGSQALIVRLFKGTGGTAEFTVGGLLLEASSPGSWGQWLRAHVEEVNDSDAKSHLGIQPSDKLFNLTVRDSRPGGSSEQIRNLTVVDSARRVDKVLEDESRLVLWNGTLDPSSPPAVTTGDDGATTAETNLPALQKAARDAKSALLDADNALLDAQDALQSAKDAGKTGSDLQPYQDAVTKATTDQGKAKTSSDNAQGALDTGNQAVQTVVKAWGAADSAALGDPDYIGDPDKKTGLYALAKADLFNLLCIPPDTRGGDTSRAVYQTAMAYCVDRRALLIVDPPAGWSKVPETATAKAIAGLPALNLTGTAARNAALYFPRVLEADPLSGGRLDTFVPCGAVAGVMARTDVQRGVWKAPAGLDAALNSVQALEVNLSDLENGQLNQLGVNCLRFFPGGVGRIVWGARTLRGSDQLADEYKYVPVRRLALYIEESLFRGTKWVVFEPNDEPLWAQIRMNVGAFMHNLFRQGAFQGSSARDAYLVKCDKDTTTQNDINSGIVNIVVGFAPLKPAEFVIIKIQQLAGQIET
jgi:phage tail sheath protein FI